MFSRAVRIGVLALALVPGVALSTGPVELFSAKREDMGVRLDWKLATRQPVDAFEISRKRPDESSFTVLTDPMPPRYEAGQDYYSYTDAIYGGRSEGVQQTGFTYKLVVRQNGQTESYMTTVEMPTAAQRSWGSIKAMFR